MSNTDSFIDEVTEDLRRDKLFATYKRYGWIAGLLVLLIVGGAAWNEWNRAQNRAAAEAFGDAVIAALEVTDDTARIEALTAVEAPTEGAPLVALLTAAESANTENGDQAAAALRGMADDPEVPAIYRDLANLRLVLMGADALGPEDRLARLEALSGPGGAFRLIAREQQALLLIEQGENDAALDLLSAIAADASSTNGQRQRAAQLVVALGGSLEELGLGQGNP